MRRRVLTPHLPPDWRQQYLTALEETGGKYLAARRTGISRSVVLHELSRSPHFVAQVDDAIELYADHIEQLLTDPATKNVVGLIVRLKALRPDRYIERQVNVGLTVTAGATVTMEHAKALLAGMLAVAQPETVRALTEGRDARS